MPERRSLAVFRLVPLLAVLVGLEARALEPDLDSAWRDYSSTRTHLEPAYCFPFANCFGTAARQ